MNRACPFFVLIPLLLNCGAALAQSSADVCPRDAAGFAAVEKKVEAHDPAAETALASCYDLGLHVKPDGKQSIRWLAEAAGQGYAPAEYELGRIYLYGRGVPADYAKALLWERKAADQGDARAQRDLAFMYERGFGTERDDSKSLEWVRKAAEHGDAAAELRLAEALENGTGVAKMKTRPRSGTSGQRSRSSRRHSCGSAGSIRKSFLNNAEMLLGGMSALPKVARLRPCMSLANSFSQRNALRMPRRCRQATCGSFLQAGSGRRQAVWARNS